MVKTRIGLIEQSIIKKYRKELWAKFVKAIDEYKLISEGDNICVCISGGKDSMLLAKLFQELKRHSNISFGLKFLVMNPGYNQANFDLILENLKTLEIDATVVYTNIFEVASLQEKNACYLCARMRRGHLYKNAKELGCNKIAIGHHFDDVIETTLMNMLNSGSFQTMLPKLHSTNFLGMELIRPMYFIREEDVKRWAVHNDLHFIRCACKLTSDSALDESASKRAQTKTLIHDLLKYNELVEYNIFKSAENVNTDMLLGYKKDGITHSFIDEYDNKVIKKEGNKDGRM